MNLRQIVRILVLPLALWCTVVLGSLFWNLSVLHEHLTGLVLNKARTFFQIATTTRLWNSRLGGVYVPVTEKTKPNPYMPAESRNIKTSSGTTLTIINHAHMTRQISEILANEGGVKFHITSLSPIRPGNVADMWEADALRALARGEKERLELVSQQGRDLYRYIAPLYEEESCFRCHEYEGSETVLRGGISITMSAGPYLAVEASGRNTVVFLHLMVLAGGGFIITFFQLRERRAAEALAYSERRFKDVVDNTGDWVWEVDTTGRYTYSSGAAKEVIGFGPSEILGTALFEHLPPEERKASQKTEVEFIERREPFRNFLSRNLHRDGRTVLLETSGVPVVDFKGRVIGFRGVHRDVTEQKRAEEELRASVREKETLLREINHRVKNNMQIISSLLNLQSGYIEDPAHAEVFRECQNRIRTMAFAHEKLYQTESLSKINIGSYIKDLARGVLKSYKVDTNRVILSMELEDLVLSLETAVPCGLIVTELVSNSVKHAFRDGRDGRIDVRLRRTGTDALELSVKDNGVGLPPGIDIREYKSLGLRLVSTIAEGQLEGTVEADSSGGTEFRIRFKELRYRDRIKEQSTFP